MEKERKIKRKKLLCKCISMRRDNVNLIKCFACQCTRTHTQNYLLCAYVYVHKILNGAAISIRKHSIMANKYLKIVMRRISISSVSVQAFQLFNFIGNSLLVWHLFECCWCSVVCVAPIQLSSITWIAANYLRFIH